MASYSVSASQLAEGRTVFIRGKLAFARLTRPIVGAELAVRDQRKLHSGLTPVGKPHTTATITAAEVVFADPGNPTVEELFVSERRYRSKKNPSSGPNYSIDSKGSTLPIIAVPAAAGDGTYDQDVSGRELAQGLEVTLVLRVYKPKNFANHGLAIEQVIVHDPPRYYNAGGVDPDELAARGIVFNGPPPLAGGASAAGFARGGSAEPSRHDVAHGLRVPSPQPAPSAPALPPAQAPDTAASAVAARGPSRPVPPPSQAETLEQKLARLHAENTALTHGAPTQSAPGDSPWDEDHRRRAGIASHG